jgi:hypothetical protein
VLISPAICGRNLYEFFTKDLLTTYLLIDSLDIEIFVPMGGNYMETGVRNETSRSVGVSIRSLRERIFYPFVCTVAATFGIFGGILALFIGLVCVIAHSVIAGDQTFDRVGTVLLMTSIPSILIGSIFLDEIERK